MLKTAVNKFLDKIKRKSVPYFDAETFLTGPDKLDLTGNGSFAKVRRCYHKKLNTVVVKYFALTGSQESIDQKLKDAEKEAIMLVKIDHQNIVRVLGVTSWSNYCGIIMKEVTGGSLEDLLFNNKDVDIPWQLRLKFFTELADALNYLHNQTPPVVHGDLKPQNVLLMNNHQVKLADFGSVSIVQATQMTSSLQISSNTQYTPLYCAPELLKDIKKRRCSSDIYSYAMIGYEIITRHRVFINSGFNVNLLMHLISENGQKPDMKPIDVVKDCLDEDSPEFKMFIQLEEVMTRCWNYDPDQRPKSHIILQKLKDTMLLSGNKYLTKSQELSAPRPRINEDICIPLPQCTNLQNNDVSMPSNVVTYIAAFVNLTYKIIENLGNQMHSSEVSLTNNGDQSISPGNDCNWSIYFNMPQFKPDELEKSNLAKTFTFDIHQVKGSLFRITPNSQFVGLKSKQTIKFKIKCFGFKSRYQVYPRWYVCAPGEQPKIMSCTEDENLGFVCNFDKPEQYLRSDDDSVVPFTPSKRYDKYDVTDFGYAPLRVIPTVKICSLDSDKATTEIYSTGYKCTSDSTLFPSQLSKLQTIFNIKPDKRESKQFQVTSVEVKQSIVPGIRQCDEAYQINIDPAGSSFEVVSQAESGAFYAAQTLAALAETQDETKTVKLPSGVIKDAPRYDYRGLFLDVASNFIKLDDLLLIIKVMAMYKLNKLVLQLSNNHGWRIEINGLPELTEVGACRRHTENGDAIKPAFGSGPHDNTSGSGYYTIDDYKKILQVASDHCIEVIPHLSMPGDCSASILSMKLRYDKLIEHSPEKAKQFLLVDPEITSYQSLYNEDVMDPTMESTYNFIEYVISSLKSMHDTLQPLKVFCIGCHGLFDGKWANPSLFKEYKKRNSPLDYMSSFHQFFLHKVINLCWGKHKIKLGIHANAAFHMLGKELFLETVLNFNSAVIYANNTLWNKTTLERAYKLANAGYKVVLSHASYLYFDHAQEPDPEERGESWANRYIDDKMVFSFKPDNLYSNSNPDEFLQNIFENEKNKDSSSYTRLERPENVLGIQASLYTRLLRDIESIHHQLFPRLLAFAERAWHKAEWEEEDDSQFQNDWASFANRVGYKELERLNKLGIKYRIPPPGISETGSRAQLNSLYPGFKFALRSYQDEISGNWMACESNQFERDEGLTYECVAVGKDEKRQSRISKTKPFNFRFIRSISRDSLIFNATNVFHGGFVTSLNSERFGELPE